MAKPVDLINTSVDTWETLITRENEVISVIRNEALTACTTSVGVVAGNTQLDGSMAVTSMIITSTLRGGDFNNSGVLTITSPTVFSGSYINSTAEFIQNNVSSFTGNSVFKANSTVTVITISGNSTSSNIALGSNLVTITANTNFGGAANVATTIRVGTNNIITPVGATLSDPASVISVGGSCIINSTYITATSNNSMALNGKPETDFVKYQGDQTILGSLTFNSNSWFRANVNVNNSILTVTNGSSANVATFRNDFISVGNNTVNTSLAPTQLLLPPVGQISIGPATINSTFVGITSNNTLFFNGAAIGSFVQTAQNNTLTGNNILGGTNTVITSNVVVTGATTKLNNTITFSDLVDRRTIRVASTGAAACTVFSFLKSNYASAKLIAQTKTTYGANVVEISEILVACDGTENSQITTYGVVHSPSTIVSANAVLGTFTVNSTTSNIEIIFNPVVSPVAGVPSSGGSVTDCAITLSAELIRV